MTSPPPMSPQKKELRRRMLVLMGTVLAVHSAVIGIYYLLHIADRPTKMQQTFIAVWVVLMLAVVTPQMKGIRKLRRPVSRR
ncbi:MAG TPA: hypothetical protein VGM82_23085 [Gemmatimonadaceae bacterium]